LSNLSRNCLNANNSYANNPRNGESFRDRLGWAITIQNIQTDLGLQRSPFPDLGLLGDYVFVYDHEKELALQDRHNDLWLEEYKKEKRRAHVQEIVDSSMFTEQEKEWMEECAPQITADVTYNNGESRHAERIVMPNLFDMRRNSHM
jgi:hypothetical protein